MGHQVENRRCISEGPQRQHHQSQVADGGIGQNPLQVGGDQSDGGSPQSSDQAHDGHHHQGIPRCLEDGQGTGHQVYAGSHHGSGVDQGANRRWTFHGVGQPDVEGELGGLARGSQEYQDGGGGGYPMAHSLGAAGFQAQPRPFEGCRHTEAAHFPPQQQDSDQQTHIADAGDYESLFGRLPGGRALEPESDQQVRADADQLPGHVE